MMLGFIQKETDFDRFEIVNNSTVLYKSKAESCTFGFFNCL